VKGTTLDEETMVLRLFVSPRESSSPDEIRTAVEIRKAADDVLLARGTVILVTTLPAPPENGRVRPQTDTVYPYAIQAVYDGLLFHGPHFHAFKSIDGFSDAGMAAALKPTPRPAEWMPKPLRSEWLADPLVLDGGLQMGLLWGFEQMGEPSLPMAELRYRQYRRFPRAGVRALLEVRSRSARRFTGDLTFLEGDQLVASCEGIEWVADASLTTAFGHAHATAR
jgi:hypothetical protein